MATEMIDGFDHYNDTTNVARKWDAGTVVNGFPAGRFGGGAISFVNQATGLIVTLGAQQTRTIGFAYQPTSSVSSSIIAQFLDAGTTQVELRTTATGALTVTRNGTTLGTSSASGLVVNGAWAYIEFQAKIDPSAGTYEVRVSGATVLSGSGANTRNTSNSFATQVRATCATGTAMIDDLYIRNDATFLGECRVFTSLPNSDGSTTQWTPSTGTSHYAVIDEANPNDDTDYVGSSTVGQIDLVKFPSISPTGSILAVQTVITARKDDVGLRQVAHQCKSGSTADTGTSTMTLGTSYAMGRQVRETDPNTGLPWTLSALNAVELGVKLIA